MCDFIRIYQWQKRMEISKKLQQNYISKNKTEQNLKKEKREQLKKKRERLSIINKYLFYYIYFLIN